MDAHTVTAILVSTFAAVIFALGVIAWFGVTRLVSHVDALQASMGELTKTIAGLPGQFVTQDQHQRDLAELRREGSVFGRRRLDHCMNPECPYEGAEHPDGGK